MEGALKGDVRLRSQSPNLIAFFFGLLSSILPFSGIRNLGLGVGLEGTFLNKLYMYVPPQRVGFLKHFGLKTSVDFAYFVLESGLVFEEATRVYERIYHFSSK